MCKIAMQCLTMRATTRQVHQGHLAALERDRSSGRLENTTGRISEADWIIPESPLICQVKWVSLILRLVMISPLHCRCLWTLHTTGPSMTFTTRSTPRSRSLAGKCHMNLIYFDLVWHFVYRNIMYLPAAQVCDRQRRDGPGCLDTGLLCV
jgi:hypothetical protein